ncbi:MAG: 1,4-alpha-glucan branching protein GlgB, partial [Deltaproteobacteria bacterium]|nr:1,4-alpha-glucan branching protein GlgB [Deltaproteobacteria bacterium]
DDNGWDPSSHPLVARGGSGIWEGFVANAKKGMRYKYAIHTEAGIVEKADPLGLHHETPPHTASILWDLDYTWGDEAFIASRPERNALTAPMSIYEVHLGSFRRIPEDGNRSLSYRELAPLLTEHVVSHGFTHVELLPVMEHPFAGSWGYQVTGFFAPTSRFGTPQDFMFLVDTLHQAGIGVILDWVPAHFPTDGHGLGLFDGTHLYEHADPRRGFHPDWTTYIFNYGRHEVRSFLISSALFWLDRYHVDGIRVDGVASMLYLDYSREEGEWIPNEHGGRENLEAIDFLRQFNEMVYERHPDVQTHAEESTSWPMVSRPTSMGGLGFGLKWDLGWMHDTLAHFAREPVHRRHHYDELTFRGLYAFNENFVLPLSHDEVVHLKGSLLSKMPGDEWQRRANLRLLFAYQWATPGKKLLFMGGELGQDSEWDHDGSLSWHLMDQPEHAGIARLVGDLNRLYREQPALHERDVEQGGFEWTVVDDRDQGVIAFSRVARDGARVECAFNFTPVPRHDYRIGVHQTGRYRELLNTDAEVYAGSGVGNQGEVAADEQSHHGRPASMILTLPPLSAVFFERVS